MKIYFCGAIKGGRQLVGAYKIIIDELNKRGSVLTEHVGDAAYAVNRPPRNIYMCDAELLTEADAVVAEITVPSLGVGYELGFAEALGKSVFCLYQAEKEEDISCMIRGNPYFEFFPYESLADLPRIISEIFAKEE